MLRVIIQKLKMTQVIIPRNILLHSKSFNNICPSFTLDELQVSDQAKILFTVVKQLCMIVVHFQMVLKRGLKLSSLGLGERKEKEQNIL